MIFSNGLSDAELERLAILAEEMGEAVQIIGKIIRHGYESYNPKKRNSPTNRRLLEKEIGDVQFITRMMFLADDIASSKVDFHAAQKQGSIGKYLHHQRADAADRGQAPVAS